MSARIRVLDTGLRSGRENIAHDAAMIECRQSGIIEDTLKFIEFYPCALIGRHQDLSQELDLEACRKRNVQTVRRMTGGGAIYMDQGQLGWGLVCDRRIFQNATLPDVTHQICEAIAAGLSRLGVDARFRPRNDIEVGGRKISGTGGYFDGNTLIFQGTIIIDTDMDVMMSVLNVPVHKLSKRELAAISDRVTSLKQILGYAPSKEDIRSALTGGFRERLGFDMVEGRQNEKVEQMADQYLIDEIGTDEFVAEINDPGRRRDVLLGRNEAGNLKAYLRVEGPNNNRIREVLFTGDIFITPPRILNDLENHLRGVTVSGAAQAIESFFKSAEIGLVSLQPSEFATAVEQAAAGING